METFILYICSSNFTLLLLLAPADLVFLSTKSQVCNYGSFLTGTRSIAFVRRCIRSFVSCSKDGRWTLPSGWSSSCGLALSNPGVTLMLPRWTDVLGEFSETAFSYLSVLGLTLALFIPLVVVLVTRRTGKSNAFIEVDGWNSSEINMRKKGNNQ